MNSISTAIVSEVGHGVFVLLVNGVCVEDVGAGVSHWQTPMVDK
jgi:hypothetical protein